MPDWLTKDFHWKAFSLLMAIGIWLTFSRAAETTSAQAANLPINTYGNVQVLAMSASADVHQAQILPATVTVTVRGTRDNLNRLQGIQIHAFVNLTGFASADNLARDVEVALPRGITLVDVDPPEVTVTIATPTPKAQ
ncbi:MAG: CdaR family protein [Limisphaerales bacterium]